MKKWSIAFFAAFLCAVHGAELRFFLDPGNPKAQGVKYFSRSIRQVPGHIGKGLLIERRTVNAFDPANVILSDGARLSGKENTLTLPPNGCAALPLTVIRPKSANTLSFLYKGEGKITVSFERKNIASFTGTKDFRKAEVIVIPNDDYGTLRIRAEKGAVLSSVMFDTGIGFANNYHAPGTRRNVDRIDIDPGLFDSLSGAVSCWLKAPWLRKDAKYATGSALIDVKPVAGKRGLLYIGAWNNGIYFYLANRKGKNASCVFQLRELPESRSGWYHFVFNWKVVKGFMEQSVIVNGQKCFKSKTVFSDPGKAKLFILGYVNGAYLNGSLCDFGLFSAPLSMDEARKIFNSKISVKELYKK